MIREKAGIAILLFIVIQFMQSCNNQKSESYNTFEDVPLVVDLDSVKRDSLQISRIRYIPLETSAECLIGNASKVLIRDNKIYVADFHRAKALFVFDLEGKFLFKIARMGQGPDEYAGFDDFDLQPNGDIHIYSANDGKFLIFNSSGEYMRHITYDYSFSSFCLVDHKMYWSDLKGEAGTAVADLAVYDEVTEKVAFVLEDDTFAHDLELVDLSWYDFYDSPDHGIYYAPQFSKVIYAVNEYGAFPAIGVKNLKMPTEQVLNEWRGVNIIERMNKVLENNYFIEYAHIYETKTHITWSSVFGAIRSRVLFYNKETKRASFVYEFDLYDVLGVYDIEGSTGSEFFTIVQYDPENNRHHKEILAAHDELANWTVDDNPVVLIFNIDM